MCPIGKTWRVVVALFLKETLHAGYHKHQKRSRDSNAIERGRLIVVGVDAEPIEVSPLQLIGASRSVVGHAAGASIDSQDALGFSALSGVRPMIETMPLSRAPEAYARMMRAEARFRMVLTMADQH